jgi:negative regulator of sigma E activity
MFDRIISRTLALGLAAVVTLAMLAGVNEMAAPGDQSTEMAQAGGTDNTPVQRVIITGQRVRG